MLELVQTETLKLETNFQTVDVFEEQFLTLRLSCEIRNLIYCFGAQGSDFKEAKYVALKPLYLNLKIWKCVSFQICHCR